MRTSDFDYELPEGRIAQSPVEPRDSARLMVVHRESEAIEHSVFRDIGRYLRPGDLLVANDSRVLPARLRGRKADTGGEVEVLLLHPLGDGAWRALVRGRVRSGLRLVFPSPDGAEHAAEVVEAGADGDRVIRFEDDLAAWLPAAGVTPLPPYIRQPLADPERYQTVYARVSGSAAAPTAGLHFTPGLMDQLAASGVGFAFVTLHIGLDTFQPITEADVRRHRIHREWAELPAGTAEAVNATRRAGGRIVAVGTTAVRVLESAARATAPPPALEAYRDWTNLFILPGHEFRAVDALVTNFHLPRSTLLPLVAAFMGKARMDRAYGEAIAAGYRFYSFGDATLVL